MSFGKNVGPINYYERFLYEKYIESLLFLYLFKFLQKLLNNVFKMLFKISQNKHIK